MNAAPDMLCPKSYEDAKVAVNGTRLGESVKGEIGREDDRVYLHPNKSITNEEHLLNLLAYEKSAHRDTALHCDTLAAEIRDLKQQMAHFARITRDLQLQIEEVISE